MLKSMTMNTCLTISMGLLLCCSSVKNTAGTAADQQLLKDVEILSSDAYEGRKTDTRGAEMARTYLIRRFQAAGLKTFPQLQGYEQPFSFKMSNNKQVNGKNLVGFIEGKSAKSDKVIVISAHYDHIGIINGQIYNGADDNASGVAALLKFAAYFAHNKPDHTLIFAAFDAEEMGLQGAKAFVANPPVGLDKLKLNINMDMISHNDKGELYVCGTSKYPALKDYFYTSKPTPKLLFGHDDPASGKDDWTNQSDQGAFNAKNIPFLYFGVEDHKDYHKATDEYQNINKTFFIDASNAILEVIVNIDKERDAQKLFHEKVRMKKQ
ncbi:Zn-dependent M28 family amino/carboxypeptidase [Pedobacter africanus]|uniref:Zn-dependent M28 family amino/carboxypeptidase n=1 Tax=Pedobacter africanus TaxID=151894 RepID=A0ACC6L100_9SPHI|nr:M28 family peptidase [Pedobacter africanus]MDR6785063.1 Zn-dependent M28 family amino/carboxypeptidase [Pedobacter africanus]